MRGGLLRPRWRPSQRTGKGCMRENQMSYDGRNNWVPLQLLRRPLRRRQPVGAVFLDRGYGFIQCQLPLHGPLGWLSRLAFSRLVGSEG
jgi:hypothetical protein